MKRLSSPYIPIQRLMMFIFLGGFALTGVYKLWIASDILSGVIWLFFLLGILAIGCVGVLTLFHYCDEVWLSGNTLIVKHCMSKRSIPLDQISDVKIVRFQLLSKLTYLELEDGGKVHFYPDRDKGFFETPSSILQLREVVEANKASRATVH